MQEGERLHKEELRARLERYLEGKDYSFNPDADTVDSVLTAMSKRFGKFGKDYCPCRLVSGDAEKDANIICPCAYHEQELAKDGHCHCHLFSNV